MAEFFDSLTEAHINFIKQQPMFFVATAAEDTRINLSPKGLDSFRILSPNQCAYLDLTGSGNETSAHLQKDGRITIMFNSFTQTPGIYRIYGRGQVHQLGTPEFEELSEHFETLPGTRQIISISIDSVQKSCGYGVPRMQMDEHRKTLPEYWQKKDEEEQENYRREKNLKSIDGLESWQF